MDKAPVEPSLSPITSDERIVALDVVRGFALVGILLMNVEFFNRSTAELGSGMQKGLSGADYWVSYFVQYFVAGKFWTIFSLLFGMGFAVMLIRAERAGRPFLVPYLRRIGALAGFGALHYILLFSGDILFSYAVAAIALLIIVYGRPKWILLAIVLLAGCGFIPGMKWLFGVAGAIGFYGAAAWWLRGEQRVKRLGNVPLIAIVLLVGGVLALIAGAVSWVLPDTPPQARFGLPMLGAALLVLGLLTKRYHRDEAGRPWRLGVGIYCFMFLMMTGAGASMYFFPEKPATAVSAEQAAKQKQKAEQRAKSIKEREQRVQKEVAVLTKAPYGEVVRMRGEQFIEHAKGEVGFAAILVGMFLLGSWFVRAGIMDQTRAHLPLFRKLALFGLPIGIGMGLAGSAIAIHPIPGSAGADGWQFAQGLRMLGNLPASLGYVSLVILMLHSATPLNRIRVLAPFGRMALTNYLTQSLVASVFFFGYGFGNWGMSRADQMLFVAVLAIVQIVFSHYWLSQFRYGPLEWLWRAVTYWTVPPMRRKDTGAPPAVATPA